jgi:hypothetical protein
VNGNVKFFGSVKQQIQPGLIVHRTAKYRLPIVTTLYDVVQIARDRETREASHRLASPSPRFS